VIRLDDKTLRQLQMIQLEMLIEVDRICRKCNIKYNIIAGTLLGAIRHGGFIPWDDDADVALLRPEYEKFREAVKTELDTTRFYFQDHITTEGYRWGYGKLRRKGTVFLRENQEHMPYEQGVFIDIFPLDGVPDNYLLRRIHNFKCTCIRKALWSAVGQISEKNTAKRLIYKLLNKIPVKLIFSLYHRLIASSNKKDTKMVRILLFPTPNKQYGYYKKWYENSIDTKFESHIFSGIKQYDEYLSFKFGDYMTPPPENMRKVHPVTDIKLIESDAINGHQSL